VPTSYTILRSDIDADSYKPIGVQEAGNGDAAITLFLNEAGKDGAVRGDVFGEGDYRSVPTRSWEDKPKPIRKKISFG